MSANKQMPTIAYWRGVPLAEVPRDELEAAFCEAHRKIARLEEHYSRLSVQHIRDLAASAKERNRARRGIGLRFANFVMGD